MLKIFKNFRLKDFLRTLQSLRGYGIPIAPNFMSIQWGGAYQNTEGSISYFLARKIDDKNDVIVSYTIDSDCIKYENGQYVYDNTKLYDGYLPDGTYFFEFNDGTDTFLSQIFTVIDKEILLMSSSHLYASSDEYISTTTVTNTGMILLKQFEDSEYYEFEQ